MGADLYIKNMDREKQYLGFEVSEKAVDAGYFRDCYNDSGLFAHLSKVSGKEFSWWQFCDEAQKKNWMNEDGEVIEQGLEVLLHRVKDVIPLIKDKEYKDWANLLVEFLAKAINLNSPVIFSC